LKTPRKKQSWFLICTLFFVVLSILSCSRNPTLLDVHGFSNLVLDKDTLWFGAGYKLYRVDLNQQTATLVYDTNDVVISFVQLDEKNLYFGGYQSPGRNGVVWSFDLNSESLLWERKFKGKWFEWAGVVTPLLINKEIIIVGTRASLHGIDKDQGDSKWEIGVGWLGDGEALTPILVDGQLFYGNDLGSNRIVIADPDSGKTLKTISMPGSLGGIPALREDCLFVKDYQYYRRDDSDKHIWIGELRLNCVDLNSGRIIWSFQRKGVPASSHVNFYDNFVLDVFANQLYAIDEQSGTLRWQSPSLESAGRNPQIIEELSTIALEIPAHDKIIFLDLESGELRDETLLNTLTSPLFIGTEAIYGTASAIIRVDIRTGDVIWSIPVDSQYQTSSDS
jgi:outer membrane protein assembly factor BamB